MRQRRAGESLAKREEQGRVRRSVRHEGQRKGRGRTGKGGRQAHHSNHSRRGRRQSEDPVKRRHTAKIKVLQLPPLVLQLCRQRCAAASAAHYLAACMSVMVSPLSITRPSALRVLRFTAQPQAGAGRRGAGRQRGWHQRVGTACGAHTGPADATPHVVGPLLWRLPPAALLPSAPDTSSASSSTTFMYSSKPCMCGASGGVKRARIHIRRR